MTWTKDTVKAWIQNSDINNLTHRAVESQKLAEIHSETDGDPRSPWGFAQGMTRYSQTLPYADQRVSIDRAAANVLDKMF